MTRAQNQTQTAKELRTNGGPMTIEVSRDREGSFEPRIVPKHQREFRGFDDKILSMYALGLTTRQIQDHLKDIYAVDVSPELISRVTDEAKEPAAEWRNRALDPMYPVLFLDALRVNIRDGAAVKLIFMGLKNISGKWTMPIRDWGAAFNQFAVMHGEERGSPMRPVYTKYFTWPLF
jgi:transposase-like protein